MTPRIHIQREHGRGYLLPAGQNFTLHAASGALRCEVKGPASAARKAARAIIDKNPECFKEDS